MKYRKKPIVIEAMRFDGTSKGADSVIQFTGKDAGVSYAEENGTKVYDVWIETLEGLMFAAPGDWIIKGVKGEFYPCKPDIFDATYEAIEDDTAVEVPDDQC